MPLWIVSHLMMKTNWTKRKTPILFSSRPNQFRIYGKLNGIIRAIFRAFSIALPVARAARKLLNSPVRNSNYMGLCQLDANTSARHAWGCRRSALGPAPSPRKTSARFLCAAMQSRRIVQVDNDLHMLRISNNLCDIWNITCVRNGFRTIWRAPVKCAFLSAALPKMAYIGIGAAARASRHSSHSSGNSRKLSFFSWRINESYSAWMGEAVRSRQD